MRGRGGTRRGHGRSGLHKDTFSFGAIDYHCADVINIFYAQSRWEVPVLLPFAGEASPVLAAQFVDQRSTGDEWLTGSPFSVQQVGIKGDLPAGDALFTQDTRWRKRLQSALPVECLSRIHQRSGRGFQSRGGGRAAPARRIRDPMDRGLSAYALWVNGDDPDDPNEFRKDELDWNLQWEPAGEWLSGLSLRLRYAIVNEHGPVTRESTDFRVILNYGLEY